MCRWHILRQHLRQSLGNETFCNQLIGTSGSSCFGPKNLQDRFVLPDFNSPHLKSSCWINLSQSNNICIGKLFKKERRMPFPQTRSVLFLSISPISLGYKKATPAPLLLPASLKHLWQIRFNVFGTKVNLEG